jgi:uncharacterized membrane protein
MSTVGFVVIVIKGAMACLEHLKSKKTCVHSTITSVCCGTVGVTTTNLSKGQIGMNCPCLRDHALFNRLTMSSFIMFVGHVFDWNPNNV